MFNEEKNKVFDDQRGCCLSLIVNRIVTRGSLTLIFKPNMMPHIKTVFYTIAPDTSHVHGKTISCVTSNEVQKKPHLTICI